ncbi:hypothetical protein ACQ3I4_09630 [Zafaria sp. Z1313]|uniref:hypothetical protein n=1 Tax=unclassified Zafaria TaxID=2828765 RepID=UPI002E79608C|nr:hypothetical protein [Zafaria sp. J156]MEE1621821.1 hypothetical protein [Zafaria sp. J156]
MGHRNVGLLGAGVATLLALGSCGMQPGAESTEGPCRAAGASSAWGDCGITVFLERSDDAARPSRAEAIQHDLSWYEEAIRTREAVTTEVPLTRYVDLFQGALEALPAAEERLGETDTATLEAQRNGQPVGTVEVVPHADGGFYVSELVFAPSDPSTCSD